jgi:hypothetical protein
LVFSTPIAPLTFSLVHLPPPPKVKVQYVQAVCGWEEVGELTIVGDHILQEFNTLFSDQNQNLQNCFTTPEQKPRMGGGLRQMNTCRKVPLQVNFFWITTFDIALSIRLIFLRGTRYTREYMLVWTYSDIFL